MSSFQPAKRIGAGGRGRSRRRRRLARRAMRRSTRLDARQQLAQVERLGDVVVGADLEADHLVDRIAAAGDDDQPAAPVLAQLARDREAVLARQAEVEQHEGGRVGGHQRDQCATAVHLRDAVSVALQVAGQQLRDVDFVVEDGDVQG